MHILGYVVLVFGVVGILLGLYGLLMPVARRRGLTFTLPRLRLPAASPPDDYDDQLEDVLAELDGSSFRDSPFDPPPPPPVAEGPPPRVIQVPPGAWTRTAETSGADIATLIAEPELEVADLLETTQQEAEVSDALTEIDEAEITDAEPEAEEEEATAEVDPDAPNADMMALFGDVSEKSVMPEALRDAIPPVTIEELLAEARAMRQLIGGAENSTTHVA